MSTFNSGPMAAPEVKPKYLKAKVEIKLPVIEADSQMWQTYDPKEMAKRYAEQLIENLIEVLESPFEDGELEITPTVEVVDNP